MKREHLSAVAELPVTNLQDIPAMLERIAARMRSGDYPTPSSLVIVMKHVDLSIAVHGLGKDRDGELCHWIGLMQLGIANMVAGYERAVEETSNLPPPGRAA